MSVKSPSLQDSSEAAHSLEDLDAPQILAFLDQVEQKRKNIVRSRNSRLTAIRSFFQVPTLRYPARLGLVTRVLVILG